MIDVALIFVALVGFCSALVYAMAWCWPRFVELVRGAWDTRTFFASCVFTGLVILVLTLTFGGCGGDQIPHDRDQQDDDTGQCEPVGHQCTLVTTCCDGVWCNFGDAGDANYYGNCEVFQHAE